MEQSAGYRAISFRGAASIDRNDSPEPSSAAGTAGGATLDASIAS